MKNRRNLLIFDTVNGTKAIPFSDDYAAEHCFKVLRDDPDVTNVEWFGREYDSYEMEASDDHV